MIYIAACGGSWGKAFSIPGAKFEAKRAGAPNAQDAKRRGYVWIFYRTKDPNAAIDGGGYIHSKDPVIQITDKGEAVT